MNDVLSDIFETIRLRATFYFRTDYSAPWAVTVPAFEQAARFHLVIQGRCHVRLESGEEADLGPGDLILIPRGREHVLADSRGRRPAPLQQVIESSGFSGRGAFVVGAGDPTASTQMVCGHFSFAEGADHPLLRALPSHFILSAGDRARHPLLDETLRLVSRQALAEGLGAAAAISRLSEVFFIESVRVMVDRCPELGRVLAAMTDAQVGRALLCLHSQPARAWTLDSLAAEVGMSRSRFAERFARLVGLTPMTYLGEWRLQKSLARLTQSQASIKEVARDAGYTSAAAFTRAFSRRFGQAPREFREEGFRQ